eukprot:5091358-Amphidinium_carterae.1
MEVERTPPQWSKEQEEAELAKPDWQLVLGKEVTKETVMYSVLLWATIVDAKTWISDVCSLETNASGDTLGNTKCGTLCESNETTSLSTDCSQEDPTSSKDDEISWASL